ncbi:DUF3392 family protein [Endozoicomonas sp.]|nr:DUF3392 family protein [Endozoicomonas sp.]
MEWLSDSVIDLSVFSRSYLPLISLMLTAVLVVYAGKPLLTWSTGWLGKFPMLLRFPVRAVLNMAALGLAFLYVPDGIAYLFSLFNNMTLAPVIIVVLFLTGAFVDRFR